jgi:hypothetical protein
MADEHRMVEDDDGWRVWLPEVCFKDPAWENRRDMSSGLFQ